jgi:hypothetical protein
MLPNEIKVLLLILRATQGLRVDGPRIHCENDALHLATDRIKVTFALNH